MIDYLNNLRNHKHDRDEILELQNRIQALEMEIAQRDQSIERLQNDLQAVQEQAGIAGKDKTIAVIDQLFRDIASTVTQILTQAYLLEVENKPVQAADVLQVARRLIRVLERNGLKIEDTPGTITPFDPSRHAPGDASLTISPGQPVQINLAGLSYQGKIIRKAMVRIAHSS